MIVFGVYCYNCNTFVYSRARHDMISCKCWNKDKQYAVAIDGGQVDYFKLTTGNKAKYKLCKMNIPDANIDILYRDWNKREDAFGIVISPNLKDLISITEKE